MSRSITAAMAELAATTRELARAREAADRFECAGLAEPIRLGFRDETARTNQESPTIKLAPGMQ